MRREGFEEEGTPTLRDSKEKDTKDLQADINLNTLLWSWNTGSTSSVFCGAQTHITFFFF